MAIAAASSKTVRAAPANAASLRNPGSGDGSFSSDSTSRRTDSSSEHTASRNARRSPDGRVRAAWYSSSTRFQRSGVMDWPGIAVILASFQAMTVFAASSRFSGRRTDMKRFTLVMAALFLWPGASVGRAESGTHTLNCGHERTIGQAIKMLKSGDTLLLTGTRNQNLHRGQGFHGLTLTGQGLAAINGDSSANAVTVTGNGITIRGFVITGGAPQAIAVTDGGTAVIDGNTIQFAARNGITVFRGSSANIVNNVIQ